MIVLITLFSLCSLIAGEEYKLPEVVLPAQAVPVPYHPALHYAAPSPVPVPVYHAPVPVPVPVSPVAAPPALIEVYGTPVENKKGEILEGVQIAPNNEIKIPENTKIDIRDKSGQYSHGFNQGGTQVSEQGKLITTNGGWEYVVAKKGSYSYTSPEGKQITVHYIADHNGYRLLDSPDSESL